VAGGLLLFATLTKTITTNELRQLRRSNADFLLLDVLPKLAFDRDHIDGARNVPLDAPGFLPSVQHAAGSKGRKIVVYCAGDSCDASLRAATLLAADGFDDVTTYEGGLAEWQDQGAGLAKASSEADRKETASREALAVRAVPAETARAGKPAAGPARAVPTGPAAHAPAAKKPFHADVHALRERARQNIDDGAVTAGYRADRATVLQLLNTALATELVCVLRYKRHQFMAQGIHSRTLAAEFFEHAAEEQGHADLLAERIVQLGGEPDFSPEGLASRSHAEYREGTDLPSMIEEDLVAERIAIESYGAMVRYLGDDDPTTRCMLERILATEEEHADELASLLKRIGRGEHL